MFEARYFALASLHDPDGVCPRVIAFDEPNRVLALEDLGAAERLDAALAHGGDVTERVATLARFLGRVHRATAGDASLVAQFQNDGMRRLHGDHIFAVPYQADGLGLSPRLERAAREIRADRELVAIAAGSYERYLAPRGALAHADVQSGNVLLPPGGGVRLLDAEIAHVGDPAFDLGTLLAHLALPSLARGDEADARALLASTWRAYSEARIASSATLAEAVRYGGLELIRRTIGAARVAAVAADEAGLHVLAAGARWARAPEALPL